MEHVEFVKHLLGEKEFEMLQVRSQMVYKPDREAIRLYLRHRLKELNGGEYELETKQSQL